MFKKGDIIRLGYFGFGNCYAIVQNHDENDLTVFWLSHDIAPTRVGKTTKHDTWAKDVFTKVAGCED